MKRTLMDLIFRNSDSPWLSISCVCVDRAEYSFCEFPGSPHHKPEAGGNTTLSSFLKEGHLGRLGKNRSYSIELNGRRLTGSVYATPNLPLFHVGCFGLKTVEGNQIQGEFPCQLPTKSVNFLL